MSNFGRKHRVLRIQRALRTLQREIASWTPQERDRVREVTRLQLRAKPMTEAAVDDVDRAIEGRLDAAFGKPAFTMESVRDRWSWFVHMWAVIGLQALFPEQMDRARGGR